MFLREGVNAKPEEKQLFGPPLSQYWRGDLCCRIFSCFLIHLTMRGWQMNSAGRVWKCGGSSVS